MNSIEKNYDWLINLHHLNLKNKSILLIGGGELSKQYIKALLKLNISDITVVTKTGNQIREFCDSNKINLLTNGFERNLVSCGVKDLVIVATPIPLLIPATDLAIKVGNKNILIEKPGSLYHKQLSSLKPNTAKIRIAYNRIVYPNFYKLKTLIEKEGGITSCRFTFTEWLNRIDFTKYQKDEYKFWGISNSLHVISMAMELIGMPKKLSTNRSGFLKWHESGSIFVGSGISEKNIPFSYHADWGSGGRWGIEIFTKENLYQLISLEELYVTPKYSVERFQVPLKASFSNIKPGLAEEIALMLQPSIEKKIPLITPCRAVAYNKLAEKIFGYKPSKQVKTNIHTSKISYV